MIKTITKSYKSFFYAVNGLKTTWREEHNFRVEVFCAIIVLAAALYFNFSFIEWALIILSITIVLTCEIINTAIEDLCNKIEPNQNPTIGKIKDTMAAFVFISSLGTLVLGILIFLHHFQLFKI